MTTRSGAQVAGRSPLRRIGRAAAPLVWIGPAVALIAVVVLWPVVVMFRTSFQHISPDGFDARLGRRQELRATCSTSRTCPAC